MKVWKWFGWDTKEARIEKNRDNNLHSTIQWAMICAVLLAAMYGCATLQ